MMQPLSPVVEQLIRDRMASGRYRSQEDLLVEALQSLDERDDDLSAIQEGLDSVDRGDEGTPLEEAFQQLRETHSI